MRARDRAAADRYAEGAGRDDDGRPAAIAWQLDMLEAAAHRKVRAVVAEGSVTSEALFDVAAHPRREWTLREWNALLAELAACDQSIGAWLKDRGLS